MRQVAEGIKLFASSAFVSDIGGREKGRCIFICRKTSNQSQNWNL